MLPWEQYSLKPPQGAVLFNAHLRTVLFPAHLRAVLGSRGPLEAAGRMEGVHLMGRLRQGSPRRTRGTAVAAGRIARGAVPRPGWLGCTRGVVVVAGVGGVRGGVHFVMDVLAGLAHTETAGTHSTANSKQYSKQNSTVQYRTLRNTSRKRRMPCPPRTRHTTFALHPRVKDVQQQWCVRTIAVHDFFMVCIHGVGTFMCRHVSRNEQSPS